MYTKLQFKEDLRNLIAFCEEEVKKRNYDTCDVFVQQIQDIIIPELYSLIFKININQLPTKDARWLVSWGMVRDNLFYWQDEILTTKIFLISDKYRDELED